MVERNPAVGRFAERVQDGAWHGSPPQASDSATSIDDWLDTKIAINVHGQRAFPLFFISWLVKSTGAGMTVVAGFCPTHPLAAEEFVGFKSALLGEDTPLRSADPIKRVKETFKRVKLHQT